MTPTPEMNTWIEQRQKVPQQLTLREQAAIAAMQGIIGNNRYNGSTNQVAETAVRYADALIKELNKD